MAAESEHFSYFPYTTPTGNCLKSFPNAYIPSRAEAALTDPGAVPPAGHALFAAPLPGQAFPLGLEIRQAGPGYAAVLHGRLLRGYTGLHFATILNPILCLADKAGVQVVPLARLTVGSPQRGSLAPWQSPPFALAEGSYRVWLTGRDGKSPEVLQVPLGQITVPEMTTGPAEAAAPPPGCPVPHPEVR